jgi:hypothetical protein
MELINATRMVAGYNIGLEPSGRELLVVVIKGTFVLPRSGEQVRLANEQLPLVMADTFTGEPGFSSPVYDVDFAPHKPMCDVLLLGSAHAPAGRAVTRMPVSLRVGTLGKAFDVVGDRVWRSSLGIIHASDPRPFITQPISYDVAFGGMDQEHEDPKQHAAYMLNPVGRGFRRHLKAAWVDGRPLPNTEETGKSVTSPSGKYRPMSFGPIGRGWEPRSQYAGTYDQRWLDEVFPFLPKDFNERHYQATPPDQQIAKPNAPLRVELCNLTPDGQRYFELPFFEAPVNVFPKNHYREDYCASLDTLIFEPDHERFTMTWRVARPLKRDIFDIAQVVVGRHTPRIPGKLVNDPEAAPRRARSANSASLAE